MERILKAQISLIPKILNFFVNSTDKVGIAHQTLSHFESRIKILEEYWAKFVDRHDDLTEFEDELKSCEYFKDDLYMKVETAYTLARAQILDKITELRANSTPGPHTPPAPVVQNFLSTEQQVSLPKISLPTFSGKQNEWESFKQRFSALVKDKPSVPRVAKLQHLLSAVQGQAAQRLSGLDITDANFDVAWDKLVRRYDNTRIRLFNTLESIIQLPTVRTRNVQELNEIIDQAEEAVRTLRVLGCPVQSYDNWLVHCIVRKLDIPSREAWEISQESVEGFSTYDALLNFLERRIQSLEQSRVSVDSKDVRTNQPAIHGSRSIKTQRGISVNSTQAGDSAVTKPNAVCDLCKDKHWLHRCPQFIAMMQAQRLEFCKREKLCLNCLQRSHFVDQCKSDKRCFTCHGKHHTKLHFDGNKSKNIRTVNANSSQVENSSNSEFCNTLSTDPASSVGAYTTAVGDSVLLATARIILANAQGDSLSVRALIDPGSERCFISTRTATQLQLPTSPESLSVISMGGEKTVEVKKSVHATLRSSKDNKFEMSFSALVLDELTRRLPARRITKCSWPHIKSLELADRQFTEPAKVDCVLGADMYSSILLSGLRTGPVGTPMAQNSVFAWLLTGATSADAARYRDSVVRVLHTYTTPSISDLLVKFWEIEEIPREPRWTPEEEFCEGHFSRTHYRNEQGRFVVRLPFAKRPMLAKSRDIAVACLIRSERRLERNTQLAEAYRNFMLEYLELKHMELAPQTQLSNASYYLPHHAVVRPENPAKIRVVFNASQKTTNGLSLNNLLLPGPKLQADIAGVITHWRFFKFVFTTDVVKMFRQILVHPDDADWQRVLWRADGAQVIQDYRCVTVTYGTASAPYLALRVMKQLADDGENTFPDAAAMLRYLLYVDDLFGGADTVEKALQRRDQLIHLLGSAGMVLGKWATNDGRLLQGLVSTLEEKEVHLEEVISTLGIKWLPRADAFTFKVAPQQKERELTKRLILSEIAKLFDPLGWLAPVIIIAKIILQDLWLCELGWDVPISDDLQRRWTNFRDDLDDVAAIRIPRWLGAGERDEWHLHGFADASKRAFAAAIYAVIPGGSVSLLSAKTKLAPTKVQSLPRLELCAAVLLVRLIKHLLARFNHQPTKIHCWSDSNVVLEWLKSHPSRWETFIANRTSEIISSLPAARWRHVRSADNAADCATRGLSPRELVSYQLWWHGPSWLPEVETNWPQSKSATADSSRDTHALIALEERGPSDCRQTLTDCCLPALSKFSSFNKILRVLARCCYWRLRITREGKERQATALTHQEWILARVFLFRAIQRRHFAEELKQLLAKMPLSKRSPLARLNPFVCEKGLIRVGGRLHHAPLPYNERHPIVLPGKCVFIERLVEEMHYLTLHGGTQLMLSQLHRSLWITRALPLVSKVYRHCVTCSRHNARGTTQQMGPLPVARTTPTRPFATTGLDYAGPIPVLFSKGRGAKSTKGYVAIFVCLVIRAIHIEIVSDLTSEAFLAAYARFCARRGRCQAIYSDNATTFKGASRELDALFRKASGFSNVVAAQLAAQGTEWRFIPPRAPHFGGLWEAAVRSFKHHFVRVLGDSKLTFEELTTLAAKIEACLNSRPLCPLSNDSHDAVALTPAHFLVGSSLLAYPEPYDADDQPSRLTCRWRLLSGLRDSFWNRWKKEVLQHLQERNKWLQPQPNLQKNDVVLIKDDLTPPTQWPLGVIIDTHPGADGLVRVVTIRTATSTFTRPIVKIIKLPIEPDLERCLLKNQADD